MEEPEQQQDLEFLGYCNYCKNRVRQNEPHKKVRKKVYHQECFEQKHDIYPELQFE